MKILDLFAGIGGFSLAASWVWGDEHETIGFCDIDEYCEKTLKKNFPNIPYYNDVQKLNGSKLGKVDIICGGFPCQDISLAGKGLGIEKGKRSGLWSEFNRLIGELRPKYAIIENVAAITSRGLNIVLRDLAETGYDAEWQCISAREVGARHKRERIWIIAYPNSSMETNGRECKTVKSKSFSRGDDKRRGISNDREGCIQSTGGSTNVSNPNSERLQGLNKQEHKHREDGKEIKISRGCGEETPLSNSSSIRPQCEKENKGLAGERFSKSSSRNRISKQTGCLSKSRLGRVADGVSYWLHEPKGIPRVKKAGQYRKERLKALGNSIVPQIPYLIMSRIKEIEDAKNINAFVRRGRKSSPRGVNL